ncbi:MAG: DUF1365 domain-containing protein [Betaproteobacteria bacterium]
MSTALAPDKDRTQALLGFGQVRHVRLKPTRHAFVYRSYFLMLPMRSLQLAGASPSPLPRNRFAPISFYDRDHGDGRGPEAGGALAWLDELLANEGVADANGEVWLHCLPRVWGFAFKPVSFWYCHRTDASLRAIVVEVNNTFGQRHCYLLDPVRFGAELHADKVFHVSPFCPVEGGYRFRFMVDAARVRTVARIDYDDALGPVLQTSVSGMLEPITPAALRRALLGYPLMTLAVVARIHWQALRLFLKRVRVFRVPSPPADVVSR